MPYLLLLAGAAILFTLLLTPVVRDIFLRWHIVDEPDNNRKLHGRPIPRVGGIAILLSYSLAFWVASLLPESARFPSPSAGPILGPLVISALVVFFTGLLDDLFKLRPWQKLVGQFGASIIAFSCGIRVDVLSESPHSAWIQLPLTVLWLVGCANAFNLIDGLDGLASGVGLFATATILISAVADHNLQLAAAAIPLAGCLIGFLRYNFTPASIFLGDCGSLTIGFFLGCCGALWSQKSATLLGMTAPIMALSIPLLDTTLSILRRFLRHKPIFSGDRAHIHHRLLDRGMTPRRAVLMVYAACALVAVLSLLQHSWHREAGGLVVLVFCGIVALSIRQLKYTEFGVACRLLVKGRFSDVIDHEVHLEQLEKGLAVCQSTEECWRRLHTCCRELGLLGVRLRVLGIVDETTFGDRQSSWQLRISLSDGDYMNFYAPFELQSRLPLAGLAEIAQTTLLTKIIQLNEEGGCDGNDLHTPEGDAASSGRRKWDSMIETV